MVPVRVAPLLLQLFANGLGRQWKMAPCGNFGRSSWLKNLPTSGPSGHMGCEPVDGKFLPMCLSFSLSNSVFQVKKNWCNFIGNWNSKITKSYGTVNIVSIGLEYAWQQVASMNPLLFQMIIILSIAIKLIYNWKAQAFRSGTLCLFKP